MVNPMITTDEKLRAVEALIEDLRGNPEAEVYKAIAKDIRARLDSAPSAALHEIERRMAAVQRTRSRLGYENGALVGVAQEVIGRWPVVKLALELFGADAERP
jgi:cobalamin biosynthesis protein CbiD